MYVTYNYTCYSANVVSEKGTLIILYMYLCLGSSAGRALCLEYGVSWVRIPPEAAHFPFGKVTALGVLCCFALLLV